MNYQSLELLIDVNVAIVTLNRPEKLNALDAGLRGEIFSVIEHLNSDDAIRVIVLTGQGRGFCSGADLTGSREDDRTLSQNDRLDDMGWVGKLASTLYQIDKPTIAAVNGIAVGAGMSLALACDMRIGSKKSRFRTMFAERGLSPDTGMSYFLPRIVGYARAVDLFFTSREIDGDESYRLGLLDRLVGAEEVLSTSLELAREISSRAPLAIRAGKKVIQGNLDLGFDQALRNESYGLVLANKAPGDRKEQSAAFREKRKPNFTGT